MKLFTTFNSRFFSTHKPGKKLLAAAAFSAVSLGTMTTGLGTVGATSAMARQDYDDCTAGMTGAGISEADAIAACASARKPEDLSDCVADINDDTGLTASSALLICQRSRRPIEVANCTIDIHDSLLESPSTKVLENCGRSLFPERYGKCVVEIADATDIGLDDALTQCIRAGYRPWRIQPSS